MKKKYVFTYTHNNIVYYYFHCEVEGDMLVSDIEEAQIFSEKQAELFDVYDFVGCEFYSPDNLKVENSNIIIPTSVLVRIEI